MPPRRKSLGRTPAVGGVALPHELAHIVPVVAKPQNPITHHFEFAGPYLGPVGILFGLPLLTWGYQYYCNAGGWPSIPGAPSAAQAWDSITPAALLSAIASSWSTEVFAIYALWWYGLALLSLTLPGATGKGIVLRDGSQLTYPLNGLASLAVVTAAAVGVQLYAPYGITLSWLFDHYAQVITAAIAFSTGLSAWLYAYSFRTENGREPLLAEGGNSGIPVYDFFIGRELNPRAFSGLIDLKYFCELRPGLFLWFLFNLSAVAKQYETQGSVDASLWIIALFQGYYVVDSVLNESAILSTMDITTDGFGFMLAFGDLAWVPGVYTLQARYLATRPQNASLAWNAFVIAIALAGMYVFRASNSQKDAWKTDPTSPQFAGIKYVETRTGTRLLAEGSWWGVARHINYFGDWVMAVSWCLPTGFATPLTYFYPLYFAVLLIHRDMRDGEKCAAKYGKSWEEYCARVPYRIVPYVY